VPWKKNNPGCPCCDEETSCEIGSDAFNRASSTNIGSDWDELSGDWEIYGWLDGLGGQQGELHCVEEGIALWTKKHLTSKQYPSFVVSVDLPNVQVGCVYGIVVNCDDEGTDYYWAKYTPSSPGAGQLSGTLTLGKGATTLRTLALGTITDTQGATDKLIVCIGEHPEGSGNGIFSASLDSYDQGTWTPDVSVLEYYGYCGLFGSPVDANTPAEFDNFSASEGWWSNQECPRCQCRCYTSLTDHRVLQMTLKLIIHVDGDNATLIACYDGVEVTLTWDDASETWQGELDPNPCAASCSGSGFTGSTIPFQLECADDTLTGHMLTIGLEPEGSDETMFATSASVCLPLSLIFSFRNGGNVACEEDEDDSQIWFEVVDGE